MTPLPDISTGNVKADQRAFIGWYHQNYHALTSEQQAATDLVEASFTNLTTIKNKPNATASLKRQHDADIAKLQAMLAAQ